MENVLPVVMLALFAWAVFATLRWRAVRDERDRLSRRLSGCSRTVRHLTEDRPFDADNDFLLDESLNGARVVAAQRRNAQDDPRGERDR